MGAVVRRDAERALSYRTAFISSAISELFSMILFYYVSRLVHSDAFSTPDAYFAFVVVGLVAFQLMSAVLAAPVTLLNTELVAGTFERLVISPLGAVAGLLATTILPLLSAFVGSVVALGLGVLVFGISLSWATVPLALPVAVLIALSFAPFGLLLMSAGLQIKQAGFIAGWVLTTLSILGGLYFPVTVLPGWISWAANVQPLTPAVDLMRHVLIGTSLPHPALVEVGKLAAFAAVLFPPSLWVLSHSVSLSRRRGTIVEY
jgi:ABC-type polysaccharide/polyol phosphate export permease